MTVQVLDETQKPTSSAADYVRVETWFDPNATMTLATIERVVMRHAVKPSTPRERVKTLIERRPMSPEEALGFARIYAASKNIPLVLKAPREHEAN